jgi:hypothetical protein
MQCANQECSKELLYLRERRLELLEIDLRFDDQVQADIDAFPLKTLPSRFFWLCGECAKTYILKRWTISGLVLEHCAAKVAPVRPSLTGQSHHTTTPTGDLIEPLTSAKSL